MIATSRSFESLARLLRGRRIAVLTGAGCSTDSGIPDYRGPAGTLRNRLPMRYQEFMGSEGARQRYWARSQVGWSRMVAARPNPAHRALARLERAGRVSGVITQNVDGLHQAAGSERVVDLHGRLSRVRCTDCGRAEPRAALQHRLERLNPDVQAEAARPTPDGDAEVDALHYAGFRVPACRGCGGVLKPDVVFFGESVPKTWLAEAWRVYDTADALLVAGSSLHVFSGRRFVLRAVKEGRDVAIVNLGTTRSDDDATFKLDAPVGEALPALADALA